jgi:hypothetical protein
MTLLWRRPVILGTMRNSRGGSGVVLPGQNERFGEGVLNMSDFLVTRIARIAESTTWVDTFLRQDRNAMGDLRSCETEDVI